MMHSLYLTAELAGRSVAIAAASVDSVVDISATTMVPRAPSEIIGLTTLRSRIVTVVDPRIAAGQAPLPLPARAIVTQIDGCDYAVLVDRVDDASMLDLEPLASVNALEPFWRAAAIGLVDPGDHPMLAIDISAMVPSAVV